VPFPRAPLLRGLRAIVAVWKVEVNEVESIPEYS
jgi:hypothetical protein